MSKYTSAIDILSEAKDKIAGIFSSSEEELHRLKLTSVLDRSIEYLKVMGGISDTSQKSISHGPATTIGGKKITSIRKNIKKEELEPEKTELEIIREKIDAAYPSFTDTDTMEIIETLDKKIILGIAKKARVPKVNGDTQITADLVDTIKEAIRKKEK